MRTRAKVGVMVVVFSLVGSCGDFFGPYPYDTPPEELEFYLGGFGADWNSIRVDGDSVHVWRGTWSSPTFDTVSVRPSPEQWRQFWIAFEEARVTAWRARYVAEGVLDGSSWSLNYEHYDTRFESGGSNRYPRADGSGSGDLTPSFRRVLAAFEQLVGQDLFYELR